MVREFVIGHAHSARRRFASLALAAVLCGLATPGTTFAQTESGERPAAVAADREGAIRLVSRTFVPDPGADPALRAIPAGEAPRHVFLQFSSLPDAAAEAALAADGVELLSYVPDRTFIAAVEPRALAALVRGEDRSGLVRWVGAIAREDRAAPGVIGREFDDFALLANGRVALAISVFRDVDLGFAASRLEAAGGIVVGRLVSTHVLVTEFPVEAIDSLLSGEIFQYVAQAGPRLSPVNNSNRAATGAATLQAPPYGLDGSGVKVLVYDAGLIGSHADLNGRVTALEGGFIADHATHVAGTVGGTGSINPNYKGMAPGVQFYSAYYESCSPQCLYNNPQDIEEDYGLGHVTNGADINTNSIGSNINPNGYPCAWEGDYETTAALVDAIVHGSLGVPVLSVWAAGNERTFGARCGSYATIGIAATAKNNVVVGATNSNDNSVTDFTSFGPTDDGRVRPDVMAPGCQSSDDFGVTSTVSGGGYASYCGTSMATPTVTGLLALAHEAYRESAPGAPDPLPATWKALLAHTADDMGGPGPNYDTGYGHVDAVALVDFVSGASTGGFFEDAVSVGTTKTYDMIVPAGTPEIRVTLAWSDIAATAGSAIALVNDLDLSLEDPSGQTHRPFVLNPANPTANATRGTDRRNVMEQATVTAPAAGTWRVKVTGFAVTGGEQDFSLVYTPELIPAAVCDVAVFAMAVDYDPSDPDVDAGPGVVGQAVKVIVSARNSGTFDVTSATFDFDLVMPDGSRVSERRTITDFGAAGGVQPLAPAGVLTLSYDFAAGLLDECASYGLEARHVGSLLACAGGISPDASPGNDALLDIVDSLGDPEDAYTPDLLRLRTWVVTAVIRQESKIVVGALEPVFADIRIRGLGSNESRTIRGNFNLRRATGELVHADLRPPTTRSLRMNIDKTVLGRFSNAAVDPLPRATPLVIEVVITDVATGLVCERIVSDTFIVIQ